MTETAAPADLAALLVAGSTAIGRGADLDAAVRDLLAGAAELAGATSAAFFEREPEGSDLRPAVAVGIAPEGPAATRLDVPVQVERDGIAVDLGVVSFGWPEAHEVGGTTRNALEAVAGLIALGVDRARLAGLAGERSEWLGRIAGLDPLTGLANRRTLDRVIELEIARADRQQQVLSIAVFDVDGFRDLNRDAGTDAGDDVLRAVAAILAEQVRLVDTVARIGGDEFIVVAPGSGGVTVADRVVGAVGALDQIAGTSVSVSAGVSRFPADGTSGEALLDAALAALEAARAAGPGTIGEARPA